MLPVKGQEVPDRGRTSRDETPAVAPGARRHWPAGERESHGGQVGKGSVRPVRARGDDARVADNYETRD